MITMGEGFYPVRLSGTRQGSAGGYIPQDSRYRHRCATCGAVFYRDHAYRYRHGESWFCGYNHMRAWEREHAVRHPEFDFGYPAWQHSPFTVRMRAERCMEKIRQLEAELAYESCRGKAREKLRDQRRRWLDRLDEARDYLQMLGEDTSDITQGEDDD